MSDYKLLLLSIFSLIFAGCSQSSSLNHEEVSDNNSLLWKIEKEGLPTSYLFGTMHLIEKDYYDFTPNLKNLIQSSDAIIMELGEMPNPIQAMMLLKLKENTLQDFFTPEEFDRVLAFFNDQLNISESNFMMTYNSFKPFFMLQSITQGYFEGSTESYDMEVMKIAKQHKKELIGLETIQDQIGFFDLIPDSAIVELIMESIDSFDKDREEFHLLQQLYSDQNVEELIPFMKKQSPELMKYEDIFLDNRNKNWIPKLNTELSNKTCFIAVGAAHLFDQNGIVSLLKKEGYQVTAIKK